MCRSPFFGVFTVALVLTGASASARQYPQPPPPPPPPSTYAGACVPNVQSTNEVACTEDSVGQPVPSQYVSPGWLCTSIGCSALDGASTGLYQWTYTCVAL